MKFTESWIHTITIKVSPEVAFAYPKMQPNNQLQAIVTIFLDQDTSNNNDLLGVIMDQISNRAQEVAPEF